MKEGATTLSKLQFQNELLTYHFWQNIIDERHRCFYNDSG